VALALAANGQYAILSNAPRIILFLGFVYQQRKDRRIGGAIKWG
jgi:hypothetical protein